MRGYHVISKGNGEVLFENFISIKQYLIVKRDKKKYLLVKLYNERSDAVSSVTLSIKQYDAKNDLLKKSERHLEDLNRKTGKFIPKTPIELEDNCVAVDVSIASAYYDNYHYAVKGEELIVTYEKPDSFGLTNAELQKKTGGVQYYVRSREFRVPKSVIFTSLGVLAGAFIFTAAQLWMFQKTEEEFVLSNVQYEFLTSNKESGPVRITGYKGNVKELIIPQEIEGHTITAIAPSAFRNNKTLKSVKIQGEMEVGKQAFANCDKLETVELGNATSVAERAFYDCDKLVSVSARNMGAIGGQAFADCGTLTSIDFSHESKLLTIGELAFAECSSLSEVNLDQFMQYGIANDFFFGCSVISKLHLKNFNYTVHDAFSGEPSTRSLSSLLGMFNTSYLSDVSIEYMDQIPESFAINLSALKTFNVTNLALSEIGDYAFNGCSSLNAVNFNTAITKVGNYAFRYTALTKFDGRSLLSIGDEAFYGCTDLEQFQMDVESELGNIGKKAFYNCESLQKIVIPKKIENIYESTFYGCEEATEIAFSTRSRLQTIGESAFEGCETLGRVDLPNGLLSVQKRAFANCTSVQGAKFPDSLGSLPEEAFYGCTELEEIHIPATMLNIGFNAFGDCSSVKKLTAPYIGGSMTNNRYIGYLFGMENKTDSGYVPTTLSEIIIADIGTSVPEYAFASCQGLTTYSLPARVTAIEEGAFKDTGLTAFTIPQRVTAIGKGAFANCNALAEITLPFVGGTESENTYLGYIFGAENVDMSGSSLPSVLKTVAISEGDTLPAYAFYGCSSIENFELPESMVNIGDYAFYNCSTLVDLPNEDKLEYIGIRAFNGCTSLTDITLTETVDFIGGSAFTGCTSLTEMTVPFLGAELATPETFSYFFDYNFYNLPSGLRKVTILAGGSIPEYAFMGCNRLREVVLPRYVSSIGGQAFANCTSLNSINIPEYATVIGSNAFEGCYRLYEVYNQSSLPLQSGDDAYGQVGRFALNIYTPTSGNIMQRAATNGYQFACASNGVWYLINYDETMTYLALPGAFMNSGVSVNSYAIAPNLFRNASSISSVVFSDAIHTVSESAFRETWASITLANSLTSIEDDAFANAYGTINGGVLPCLSYLGENAFNDSGIVSIDFTGSSFNEVKNNTFYSCDSLTSVSLPSYVNKIGESAFNNCYNLTSVSLPTSLTEIDDYAFNYCSALNTISLPSSLDRIGVQAFYNCSVLPTVYLGTVEEIGSSAFSYCTALTSVSIPSSLTAIGDAAFYGCSGLTNVTFASGVTSVASSMFSHCTALTNVSLPNSISDIGAYAFYSCTALTSIVLPSSLQNIYEYAFNGCSGLRSITLPSSLQNIYYDAFYGCSALYEVYDLTSHITITKGDSNNGYVGYYAVKVNTSASATPIVYETAGNFEFFKADDVWYLNKYLSSDTSTLLSLPATVTLGNTTVRAYSIYKYAFTSWMNGVVIPASVTALDNNAFSGISTLYYQGTQSDWDNLSGSNGVYYYSIYYYVDCVHESYQWKYVNGQVSTDIKPWTSTITTPATCQTLGELLWTCPDCGDTRTEEIPFSDHRFVDNVCEVCEAEIVFVTEENIDEHTCIENDEAYPFEIVGNIMNSTNKNHGSESFLTITATEDMTVMFEYKTSSESGHDRLIISLNGFGVAECSGITSYEQKKVLLSAGDTLTFSYCKDGSVNNGGDCAYIKNLAFVYETERL